mgnify:CR=1 FL=1|jgi:hypothetical protein|tara:strand:- start:3394 stop:3843 length:450 start_codon:yes stop_codon:yes gene_type:complete
MKKLLLILLCLPLLFNSCINDSQNNTLKDSRSNAIISFSVTSKNSDLTSSSGKDVSLNEMTTINIHTNDNILFKDFNFTLDNKVDGALNFYSNKGSLMCNAPTKLSTMSMPPNGNGLKTYNTGDDFEISAMTLVKVNSTNFVISNIKSN